MNTSRATLFGFIASVVVVIFSNYIFNANFVLAAACLLFVSVTAIFLRGKESNAGSLLLLILTSFLFLWGRPIIGILDSNFNLSIFELQDGIDISDKGLNIYLEVMFASMVTFSFTLLCLSISRNFGFNQECILQSRKNFPDLLLWKMLFNIGILFSLIQAIFYLQHFVSGGTYYEIFTLGKDAITFPGLSFLAGFLFIGYVGVLVSSNDKDISVTRYVIVFLFISLLQLIKGSRGEVFSQILVGVWLYYFYLKRSPRLLHLFLAFLSLIIIAEFVSFFRADNLDQLNNNKDLLLALKWFIYSQGASGELVGVVVDFFEVNLSSFRFIVSPLLNPFRRLFDSSFGGQTADYGESSGLLAHEISWRLSPDLYLSGHGVGSSYIAESFLAMGLVGVIATSSLMIYVVSNPRGIFNRSKIAFFVFTCALPYILFTPRESLVYSVVPAIKAYIVFLFINFIYARFSHRCDPNLQSSSPFNGNSAELSSTRRGGDHSG